MRRLLREALGLALLIATAALVVTTLVHLDDIRAWWVMRGCASEMRTWQRIRQPDGTWTTKACPCRKVDDTYMLGC